ncbi:putative malate dehydrogenase 1B isoform X2 [Lepisosteus oculatus]|uniref:putative malate dehydrogenase 1B isoform X2 n=1 Tax=Lepisosteus oculatus TaxID=7918 RepID=UPI0035F52BD7
MAKFVLAGRADCPYYAKAELLADLLQRNLPSFSIYKICHHPKDWEQWLEETCEKNGWKHDRSPIVWRELVDRGGKELLLGGFSEFLEHAQGYYGVSSDMMTEMMKNIASENLQTKIDVMEEEAYYRSLIKPLHIWITSALSPVCYALLPMLGKRDLFSENTVISLHLLDIGGSEEELCSLKTEAEDLALPIFHEITIHTELSEAFRDADVVLILDDIQPEEDQALRERAIKELADRCQNYGLLIDSHSHKEVRVVVAGNSYVNLKCLVVMQNAPSINPHQFVATAIQLENEARAQLAKKLNINTADVKDVIVWGNITGNSYIDLQRAKVFRYDGAIFGPPDFSQPVLEVIYDRKWLETDFLASVRSRRCAAEDKMHRPAGLSAANGIATVLQCWNHDSPVDDVLSLGVISEGQFGIPKGLVFSMPVKFQNGAWIVLSDVEISDTLKENLIAASNELMNVSRK